MPDSYDIDQIKQQENNAHQYNTRFHLNCKSCRHLIIFIIKDKIAKVPRDFQSEIPENHDKLKETGVTKYRIYTSQEGLATLSGGVNFQYWQRKCSIETSSNWGKDEACYQGHELV